VKSFLAKVLVVLGTLAVPLTVVIAGFAYWTVPGSGSAMQAVSALTAPAPIATSPTPGFAHIAWSAVTLDPPVPVVDAEVTFTVERKLSSGSIWSFVCGTGTTPKPYDVLSCDDAPPVTGTYDYRVTAALRTWTSPGVASVAVVTDTVPPTSFITFPGTAVYSAASWNAVCSSSMCGTASDTGGSGLLRVDVSIRQGGGSYWNGGAFASASEVWNLAGGTTSWSYAFSASSFPADGQYTVSTRATDNAANSQSPVTTRTFTIDTTAPSVTASTIAATVGASPAGFAKQGGGYNVYADVSDSNGVASVTANASNVTTGQTAVALTACVTGCTVGGQTYQYKSALLTATTPLTEGSKSYTVSAVDVVSNTSAAASFAVMVDNTAPSVATVIAATTGTSPQGFVRQASTYRVYANVTDLPSGAGAASGVNASSITANVATVTTGQTAVALTACGTCGPASAYAYQSAELTANNPLSEGSKVYTVSAADNLASNGSSSGAVMVDNTAPTVVTVLANTATNEGGWLAQAGTYRVYANVTDLPAGVGAASGVNASSITTNVSAVTTGQTAVPLTTSGCPCTISGTSYAYRTALLTADSPLSAGAKSFTTSASDNLAATTNQSGSVTVDNTAPTLTALQMFDTDTNGRVNRVTATFSETLYTYSAGTAPWTLANAPGGASNTLASVSVATTVATLTLNEGIVNTAAGLFTVALAQDANGVRDAAGNLSLFAATAVSDRAAPVPVDVVMTNVRTAGRVRRDDTFTVTYSEVLDATSFCSTWTNGSTQTLTGNGVVDVLITNSGSNDVLSILNVGSNCGGGANFRFGSVALGQNYVTSNTTFSGNNANASVLTWNPTARTLTITLGTGDGSQSNVPASIPVYTPNALLDDLATPGNSIVTTPFSAPATSRF
jgi:Bacterial Ig-like domain (group 3)